MSPKQYEQLMQRFWQTHCEFIHIPYHRDYTPRIALQIKYDVWKPGLRFYARQNILDPKPYENNLIHIGPHWMFGFFAPKETFSILDISKEYLS